MKYVILLAVQGVVIVSISFIDTMIALAISHIFGFDFIYTLVYIMFASLVTAVTAPGISEATHRYTNSREFADYLARLRSTSSGTENNRVPASRPVATSHPRGRQSRGDAPLSHE